MSDQRVSVRARARGMSMLREYDCNGKPCIDTTWAMLSGEHKNKVLTGRFWLHTTNALNNAIKNLTAAGCTFTGADFWDGAGFGAYECDVGIVTEVKGGRVCTNVTHVRRYVPGHESQWAQVTADARRLLGQREPLELRPSPQPRESYEQRAVNNIRTMQQSVDDLPVDKGGWKQ